MKVKNIFIFLIIPICSATLFFIATSLLASSLDSSYFNETYLSAPIITGESGFSGRDNGVAWIYGALAPADVESLLQAPVSKTGCLYYYSEKRQGTCETDSDGDSYRVWTVVESDIKSVETVIKIGDRGKSLEMADAAFYNLVTAADRFSTDDGIDFNYREYIVPMENKVWVMGKIENNSIIKTDKGLLVSLAGMDSLVRQFNAESVLLLFFSILCFIGGAGFLAVLIMMLLKKKMSSLRPLDAGMLFLAIGFFWIVTGLMLVGLSEDTAFDRIVSPIVTVAVACAFVIPPLATTGCRPQILPFILFFPTAIGLSVLGSFFLYDMLFMLAKGPLPLFMDILCLAAAVSLVQVYRLVFARPEQ